MQVMVILSCDMPLFWRPASASRMLVLTQAAVLKPAVASLSYVLAAADPGDWPSAARPFALLLGFATNPRPKVRKRAHDGMVQVLAAWQHTAALQPASAAILQGALLPLVHEAA